MIIPIVRRSVTVRTNGVFDLAFACERCQLQTIAHVAAQGAGQASALYISANADRARESAASDAQQHAYEALAACLCPRCGAPSAAMLSRVSEWEQKAKSRAGVRRVILFGGLAAALASSAGCGAIVVSSASKDSTVAAAVILSLFWGLLCLVGIGIVYALAGPGRRPILPTMNPPNVRFE